MITDLVFILPSSCFHLCLIPDNKKVYSLKPNVSLRHLCIKNICVSTTRTSVSDQMEVQHKISNPRIAAEFSSISLKVQDWNLLVSRCEKDKCMFSLPLQDDTEV